jgi:choline dehydrogenase-like flavoprotein
LGNDNGLLGKFVAFHNYRARIFARYEGMLDHKPEGSRASYAYIPRFRNVRRQETSFLRGYATTFSASRNFGAKTDGFGKALKEQLLDPDALGGWSIGSTMMGETIPKESNFITLDNDKKDEWGVPLVKFSISYDDNDEKMIKDFISEYTEMYMKAGFLDIRTTDSKQAPGLDIHEMGGVRMGKDPKTSLLNEWHQLHACPNVIVTDGACMTSTSTQNPSLTYMAMAARAANHVVELLKKKEI